MTAKELIDKLSEFPPENRVCLYVMFGDDKCLEDVGRVAKWYYSDDTLYDHRDRAIELGKDAPEPVVVIGNLETIIVRVGE